MSAKQIYWPRATLLTANLALPALTLAAGLPWAMMWLCFAIHNALAYALTAPRCPWLGPLVTHFATEAREVWLTIDDGPDGENTVVLAQELRRRGVPATFFCKGRTLRAQPEAAATLLREGHTLGNHTFTHPMMTFWLLWPARLRREIDATNEALVSSGVASPRLFRAPLGLKNVFLHPLLTRRGMRQIAWNARGRDGVAKQPAKVLQRIATRAQPGAIIVLHELMPRSNETILQVVEMLHAQGYTFVIPGDDQLR